MSFKQWFTQEYDRDLEKRIKDATRFGLTQEEREQTRTFLASYMRMHPARARIQRKESWIAGILYPYPIIASLLIVTLGGSSAGAAVLAENALPGDVLYPIKVNVNEEVRAALATTPEKKADVAIARAERRIDELNTLAARGEIVPEIKEDIDKRIDEQVRLAEAQTALSDDGAKEKRLVAMLRIHENLVAESEVGGIVEPDVSIAAMVATDISSDGGEATMMAAPASAPEDAGFVQASAPAQEVIARTAVTAPPVPEERVIEAEVQAKKNEVVPSVNTKTIERQKKAAKERIEALEKLLERQSSRVEPTALSHAQNELSAARTAFEEGDAFLTSELWSDAAVRFNAAIRIAIDAREFVADAPRTEQKKEGDRSGRDGSSRSGKNRDHDDD